MRETTIRQVKATEQVVVAITCDRCGADCGRPSLMRGKVSPVDISVLARSNDQGNWPEVERELQLCHACGDDLLTWISQYERA